MKAAVFHEQGGPEVLRYEDAPDPVPNAGEAVVRVHCAALNRLDLKAREGRPEVSPMPHIGGLDVSGEIAALGEGVAGWRVGERVVVAPALSCGVCRLCRRGEEALCAEQRVFGFQTQGGFAEYVAVPTVNLIRVPPDSDMRMLAAVPTVYATAWHMLITRARLRADETVLIHSVGSGVGSAALQIAKFIGARTIGTASDDAKLDKAREMGADAVVNYRKEDTLSAVREFTEGEGADVVVETVGSDTWETSLQSAAKNGRVVTCGVTSGSVAPTNIRHLYQRQIAVLGSTIGGKAELQTVLTLVLQGRLRPTIAQTFRLSEIQDAHRALESRAVFGKIVMVVCD